MKGVLNVNVGRCDIYYGKMYRMENFFSLFSNLFPQKRKRISANTCVHFGKYAHVFPQIFLRISANKFDAGLKKRCFVPSGDSLRLVPAWDMYTSQAGTKVRARRGRSYAPGGGHGHVTAADAEGFMRIHKKRRVYDSQSLPVFLLFAIARIIGSKTIMRIIPKPT